MTYKTKDIVRLIVTASLIFGGVTFTGAAAEEESKANAKGQSPKLASTDAEWQAMLHNKSVNIIRSLNDWKSYVAQAKTKADHPLASVDEATVKKFTDELVFMHGGLAGASYEMLEGKLTEKQFDALWAAFGMSAKLVKDNKGYRCESRATCAPATSRICTSNCRS